YTCRAAIRGMMKRKAGSIVNVSSIVGIHGNLGQTNYGASKAGIIGFTKSLAREVGSRNVRANVVAPGYVHSRLTEVLPEEAPQRGWPSAMRAWTSRASRIGSALRSRRASAV